VGALAPFGGFDRLHLLACSPLSGSGTRKPNSRNSKHFRSIPPASWRSFAPFLDLGYAQAAVNSTVETSVAPDSKTVAPIPARVLTITPERSKVVCGLCESREIALSGVVGSHVRVGDELLGSAALDSAATNEEIFIHKPTQSKADVYQVKVGYAALPKQDKRGELFVRVEIVDSQLEINAVHIPCHVIRDYFFSANRSAPWSSQPSFYHLLHLPEDVRSHELRLGYRIRRIELRKKNASKIEMATVERAYNMLADPDLRALYHELRRNPTVPVPFPYAGFGALVIRGERAAENGVFFANRILAFMPERRSRKVPVPLRKLDYFDDYAILRDPQRKLEVLIDQQLLPIRWDPTWSQWRHLITSTVEISADFIHTGRYRKHRGEWKLVEWETALPSRTELEVPEDIEEEILKARRTHSRFGEYWKHIDHLRAHVQQIPTERGELQRLCWNLGLPGDFDVAQITWRPDYDPFYHEELIKRARTMYMFREEYLFDLEKAIVVEVPQAGHATYVFEKPDDIKSWLWLYAETTKRDIRLNRDNTAGSLGFVGRVVHGSSKTEWLRELRLRIGEAPDAPSVRLEA
jgi:hypothetical protein